MMRKSFDGGPHDPELRGLLAALDAAIGPRVATEPRARAAVELVLSRCPATVGLPNEAPPVRAPARPRSTPMCKSIHRAKPPNA
jgi:hypothetical protein